MRANAFIKYFLNNLRDVFCTVYNKIYKYFYLKVRDGHRLPLVAVYTSATGTSRLHCHFRRNHVQRPMTPVTSATLSLLDASVLMSVCL